MFICRIMSTKVHCSRPLWVFPGLISFWDYKFLEIHNIFMNALESWIKTNWSWMTNPSNTVGSIMPPLFDWLATLSAAYAAIVWLARYTVGSIWRQCILAAKRLGFKMPAYYFLHLGWIKYGHVRWNTDEGPRDCGVSRYLIGLV